MLFMVSASAADPSARRFTVRFVSGRRRDRRPTLTMPGGPARSGGRHECTVRSDPSVPPRRGNLRLSADLPSVPLGAPPRHFAANCVDLVPMVLMLFFSSRISPARRR